MSSLAPHSSHPALSGPGSGFGDGKGRQAQRFGENQRQKQEEEDKRGKKWRGRQAEGKRSKDGSRDGESERVLGLTKENSPFASWFLTLAHLPLKMGGVPAEWGLQPNSGVMADQSQPGSRLQSLDSGDLVMKENDTMRAAH